MANGRGARRAPARAAWALVGAAWLAGAQSVESPAGGELPTLSLEGVRDATGEGLVALELGAERSRVFAGETVRLTWRASFERRFFEERLIQLFRRALDVPVQIQTRGLGALGAALDDAPGPQAAVSLAFDELLVGARRLPSEPGSERVVFELARAYRVAGAGELVLAPALLRYAWATSYREDLLNGRVPLDRQDAYVRSNALALTVVPLPEEGRPPEFSGLVGSLSVRARAEPDELEAGEPLRLILTLASDGDLDLLRAPRIDERGGLRVQGTIRQPEGAGLTLVYDLVPERADLRELPGVPFVVFDPTPPGAYRTVHSPPVAIIVRPRSGSSAAVSPSGEPPAAEGARSRRRGGTAALLFVLFVLLVLLALRRARRRTRAATSEVLARSTADARGAAEAFRARAAGASPEELSHALLAFLAARLAAPEASVIGSDLRQRLVAAGAAPRAAARAAELLDELVGARYGGPSARVDEAELCALVEELAAPPLPER